MNMPSRPLELDLESLYLLTLVIAATQHTVKPMQEIIDSMLADFDIRYGPLTGPGCAAGTQRRP